jgi:DNA-binding CsgD family transcriptional regulator
MSGPRALAPRMIGRQGALQDLEVHLGLATSGSGRVVFVVGEAGVGKTCLTRAFIEQLRAVQAVEILEGQCYEEDEGVPYGPFIGVLRSLVRAHGPSALTAAAGQWAEGLFRLLPEWQTALPVARRDDGPQEQKRRFFETIYRVIRPESEQPCRIVVLEDLHWADESSQELVRFLARAIEGERLLVLGTYRSDELHRRRLLNHHIAQLMRERRYHEVQLRPLSRDDLARMLEAILGETPPNAFVYLLHDHTGGNPFIVEEILKALIAQNRLHALITAARHGKGSTNVTFPPSLQESILSRTADLDEQASAVLTYAAVIGRRFDFELLLHLTGMEEAVLVRAIETLIAGQLVVEERDDAEDRYAFRHALTREVVYGHLLGRERRLRHRAILEALEEMHAATPAAVVDQLAYHSLRARELEKVARYALLAGERAARMSAWREAVAHYETALELLGADDPRAQADLYDRLGEVAFPIGDTDVYLRYWREAQRLYEEIGDRRKVADVLRRLGQATWERGETQAALECNRAAIAELEAEPPGPELGMAYSALARRYALLTRPDESILWGEKALHLAEALGDERLTPDALNSVAIALSDLGEWQKSIACLERSRAVAERHGMAYDMLRACNSLGDKLFYTGDFRRAARVLREGLTLADQHGFDLYKGFMQHNLAEAEMALGHWDESRELIEQAILAGKLGYPIARLVGMPDKGELLLRQGRLEEAQYVLEEILPECEQQGEFQRLHRVYAILAQVYLARGNIGSAMRMIERGVALWRETRSLLRSTLLLRVGVEVALAAGHDERVDELIAGLTAIAADAAQPLALAYFADAQGLIAMHEGRNDDAAMHFQDAIERWQAMGCPYEEAGARQHWAEIRLLSGEPDARRQASTALITARETFARLAARLEIESVDAVMKEHGLTTRTTRSIAGGAGALTPREREVLILIAQGKSNREIAEELFISQKTTEIHVGHILSKLGCTSRTQAATLALAHGLVVTADQ